jgi:hypothetical protein
LELLNNEKCAKFIGGDTLVDPSYLLGQLTAGNPQYGNIQVAPIEPIQGYSIGGTTQIDGTFPRTDLSLDGSPFVNPTVAITMNSNALNWQYPAGDDFGVSQATRNALDILHEQGHAISDLFGALGISGIMHDGPQVPGGFMLSQINKNNTIANCLH